MLRLAVAMLACASVQAFGVPMGGARSPTRAPIAQMQFGNFFGGGNKAPAAPTGGMNARDADFARRQDKLAARQAKGASQPKGSVEVTFPQKGNKVVKAKQGEPLGKVISRAGLKVKFDCKVSEKHIFRTHVPLSADLANHR